MCPRVFRPFFRAVAKNFGASGFIGPACVQPGGALTRLLQGEVLDLEKKEALQKDFPILHVLASSLRWDAIPDELRPYLEILSKKAAIPSSCPEVNICLVAVAHAFTGLDFESNLIAYLCPDNVRLSGMCYEDQIL